METLKMNKKKIIIIIAAILLVIAVTVGTIFIFRALNNQKNMTPTPVITKQEQADTLKTQAIEAMKNNDNTKAKELLQDAQQQYEDLNDTNNVVDTAAQLYLIDNPVTPQQ